MIDGKKYPFKLPRLSKPDDNDLTKQWVVEYGVWSIPKEKIVRKRIVLAAETAAQRLADAQYYIKQVTSLLESGNVIADAGKVEGSITEKPVPVLVDKPIAELLLHEAAIQYLDICKKTVVYNTYKCYKRSVFSLLTYLERNGMPNMRLVEFTQEDAYTYLDELKTVDKLGNRTRNNRMTDLVTVFNHFIDRDKSKTLVDNPFIKINKLPAPKHKHQSYSRRQQEAYKDACIALGYDQLLLFVRFMYYTFLRPGQELRRLQIRDIRRDMIFVSATNAKTDEADYVDIPAALEKLIQQYKLRDYPDNYYVFSYNDQPGEKLLGPNYLYRRHVKVLEKMNLTDTNHDLYSWKHTGAIALWDATHDIELIRRQCRHTDIGMTIQYLRDLGLRVKNDKIHDFPEL